MDSPKVDFYILSKNTEKQNFVCTLIQKAWKRGHNIFVNTRTKDEAATLDDLLWTFKDISFVPHCIASDDSAKNSPIIIDYDNQMNDQMPSHAEIMLNLTDKMPLNTSKLKRILEIVAGSEDERQRARKRYAEYSGKGYELSVHKIEF